MKRTGLTLVVLFLGSMMGQAELVAQEDFGIYILGGLANDPSDFDVEREVDYGTGVAYGGGLSYRFGPLLSIRGDVGRFQNSGDETGFVEEPVDFTRTFYTVKLQLSFEAGHFTPYVFGGGGLVTLEREADNYGFDFTEATGAFGAGIHFGFPNSSVGVFLEGDGWIYSRNTVEGSQFDTAVLGGMSFTFP